MTDESAGIADGLTKLPQRMGSLIELLTTLDQRVIQALDSVEKMSSSVARFEGVGDGGDELVRDLQERLVKLDERLNRDLDDLNAAVMEKLADVDLTGFNDRLGRLEEAVFNIERATISLDRAFEGTLEMLPDFMTKRLKGEGKEEAPAPPGQMPP